MAWSGVPFVTTGDWEGFNWQATAFWQQFVDAIELRVGARSEVAGGTAPSLTALANGCPLQTVAQINALRSLHGTYQFSDNALDTQAFDLRDYWMDKDHLANGNAWTVDWLSNPAEGVLVLSDGTVTQAFVDRVNDILTGWGCPTMGATVGAGGTIPWTRKYGNPAAPTTANGEMQAGDIIGPWIFNEWRAVLEALDCLWCWPFSTATQNDAEYTGSAAVAEPTCADAKTAIAASYGAGGAGTANLMLGQIEAIDFGSGLEFGGQFDRSVPDWAITPNTVANATEGRIWMSGRQVGAYPYNDFGDGVDEDEISFLATFALDGVADTYAPAVPTTCGISAVTCPTVDGQTVVEGYDLQTGGAAVVFSFPAP